MKKILIQIIAIFSFFIMISTISYAENSNENNAYLKTMRLDIEGVEPYFNKDINEYYITVGKEINSIEVNAEAEDNGDIEISGNENIIDGLNTIKIQVSKENMQNTYYIYVTKTDKIETANAKLENLALEGIFLTPEFSNNYSYFICNIPNSIESIKVLAIPQNIKAKVEISGNENLLIGNNQITIKVTAENGKSFRRYYINAYRRNKTEETDYEEQQNFQAVRLSALLNDDIKTNLSDNIKENNKSKSDVFYAVILIFSIVTAGIVIYIAIKIKRSGK